MAWKEDWSREIRSHVWVYLFQRGIIPRMIHLIKFKLFPYLKKIDWVHRLQENLFAKEPRVPSPKPSSTLPPQPESPEETRKEAA